MIVGIFIVIGRFIATSSTVLIRVILVIAYLVLVM